MNISAGAKRWRRATGRRINRACFETIGCFFQSQTRSPEADMLDGFGKTLIYIGIVLIIVGIVFSASGKIPWLGNLPGDIYIQRGRFTFYFPLATCLLISV